MTDFMVNVWINAGPLGEIDDHKRIAFYKIRRLLHDARNDGPNWWIPVVAVTASAMTENIQRMFDAGFDGIEQSRLTSRVFQ